MNARVQDHAVDEAVDAEPTPSAEFDSLLRASPSRDAAAPAPQPLPSLALVTGVLVGFIESGRVPLVTYPGQPGTAAFAARSIVDLTGANVGKEVMLAFEAGDATRPIVLGALRERDPNALSAQPGHVEVDVDGQRMIVSAKDQLVLRCGQASITLTKAGKVLIEGTYVSSRSSGVQRIKGGSIQLN
jgi:hypothetical protein